MGNKANRARRTEEIDYIEDEKGDEKSPEDGTLVAGMSAAEARRPGGGAMRVRRGQGAKLKTEADRRDEDTGLHDANGIVMG